MSEVNKYLNRDGLEEYNSLLPHSSGEMQEYVNDWLDEHPEATTTVQDGAITEPKLADKSVSLRTLADDTVHMLKGMILTQEISGKVLTADDAYSAPPMAFTVEGKSTQDGTPTPDVPVEIVSVEQANLTFAGKNLIPTVMPDNAIHAQMSGATITSAGNAWVFAIPCARNTDYYFSSAINSTIGVLGLSTSLPKIGDTYTRLSGMANYRTYAIHTGENDYILIQVANAAQFDAIASNNGQLEVGSTATAYQPYSGTSVLLNLTQALRSLPSGIKDTLELSYLRPSTRDGWAWYSRTLTALVGETTTAATDGVTGTVGVDVMSTTGEIADGPTVLYKLASSQVTDLGEIELPVLPAPTCNVWSDPTTGLQMEYVRDANIVIQNIEQAIADL